MWVKKKYLFLKMLVTMFLRIIWFIINSSYNELLLLQHCINKICSWNLEILVLGEFWFMDLLLIRYSWHLISVCLQGTRSHISSGWKLPVKVITKPSVFFFFHFNDLRKCSVQVYCLCHMCVLNVSVSSHTLNIFMLIVCRHL